MTVLKVLNWTSVQTFCVPQGTQKAPVYCRYHVYTTFCNSFCCICNNCTASFIVYISNCHKHQRLRVESDLVGDLWTLNRGKRRHFMKEEVTMCSCTPIYSPLATFIRSLSHRYWGVGKVEDPFLQVKILFCRSRSFSADQEDPFLQIKRIFSWDQKSPFQTIERIPPSRLSASFPADQEDPSLEIERILPSRSRVCFPANWEDPLSAAHYTSASYDCAHTVHFR